MYASKFFFPTMREAPKDAVIPSHVLMLRAGLVRRLSSGIYGLLPLGLRVVRKVEEIIRREMNAVGANEFLIPVLIPGELWKQSGRWSTMGQELFRLQGRNEADYVLAPTHEEAFTRLLKDHIRSYRDLPLTVYHIGPKFRDEIRPRFGVMRGKSFIMKDAYSFHHQDDPGSLDRTYTLMAAAYRRIFSRCGLHTVPVSAHSGAMGGSESEEFMVPAEVGEEEIMQCPSCGYAANRETAACRGEQLDYRDQGPMAEVHTPGVKTIEDLARFLDRDTRMLIKTLIYRNGEGRYVLALIRGDLELNETKLGDYLGTADLCKAEPEDTLQDLGIPLGFVGPVGVQGAVVVADHSVEPMRGGVIGANRRDYHYINVNPDRDFQPETYTDLRLAGEGDGCPRCGTGLGRFRGIELGHIFKLGDKYTRAFQVTYLEENGGEAVPVMGCYGIGIERTVAAVIEQNHDPDGIVWPVNVAPFQVYLLPVKFQGRVAEVAVRLHDRLSERGIEVLLDDRELRTGVKFKDADLIGIPFRVTIGDRGLESGAVELYDRRSREKRPLALEEAVEHIVQLLAEKGQPAENQA